MDQEPIFQTALQSATAAVKWSGAGSAVWWGVFSFNEWMDLFGLLVAVIGSIVNSRVNSYYRNKEYLLKLNEDKRAQERHDAITAGWTQ